MRRLLWAAALFVLMSGCARGGPTIEIRAKPLTPEGVKRLMRQAKKDPPRAIAPKDYAAARDDAIAAHVAAANEAGLDQRSLKKALDLVTPRTSKTQVLPTRVVKAAFEGREAWIIVQNWNKPGDDLTHVKVWAIAVKNQSMLYAASER